MSVGAQAWDAAQALIGTRFRLQGRDPATGLDCVGVALAAYAAAGVRIDALDDYALRGFPLARAMARFSATGLQRATSAVDGDIALFALPAGQLHIALLSPERMIHADALLRRVVVAPDSRLPPPVAIWRWED